MAAMASSGVVATTPPYRSTSSAAYPADARRSAQCLMLSLRPHHSWMTMMAGNGPLPAGRLTYAFVPLRSKASPLSAAWFAVGAACSALNSASLSGPVDAGVFSLVVVVVEGA